MVYRTLVSRTYQCQTEARNYRKGKAGHSTGSVNATTIVGIKLLTIRTDHKALKGCCRQTLHWESEQDGGYDYTSSISW